MAGCISNQAFSTTDWRTRLQRDGVGVFESGSILHRPKPRNNPDLRSFCLPHLGVGAADFGFGQTTSRKTISIHMPGRPHRHQQYPLTRIQDMESPQRLSAL